MTLSDQINDHRPGVWAVTFGVFRQEFYIGLLPASNRDGRRLGRFFVTGRLVDESASRAAGLAHYEDQHLPAPEWCYAAFAAGEPVEPVLDHLVELHGDTRPWLAEAVRRAYTGTEA